jgi:hypothetical protein
MRVYLIVEVQLLLKIRQKSVYFIFMSEYVQWWTLQNFVLKLQIIFICSLANFTACLMQLSFKLTSVIQTCQFIHNCWGEYMDGTHNKGENNITLTKGQENLKLKKALMKSNYPTVVACHILCS